jgi:hypothetical protein
MYVSKIRCDGESKTFCKIFWQLNIASVFWFLEPKTALCYFGRWMTSQPVDSCLPEDTFFRLCDTASCSCSHVHGPPRILDRVEGVVLVHELLCNFSFRKVGNSCKIEIIWSTPLKIQPSVKPLYIPYVVLLYYVCSLTRIQYLSSLIKLDFSRCHC